MHKFYPGTTASLHTFSCLLCQARIETHNPSQLLVIETALNGRRFLPNAHEQTIHCRSQHYWTRFVIQSNSFRLLCRWTESSIAEHVGENVAIDPNQLFSYFSPELFFNSPIKSSEQWYVVARQTVPADYNAFWQTVVRFWISVIGKDFLSWAKRNTPGKMDGWSAAYHTTCAWSQSIVSKAVPRSTSVDRPTGNYTPHPLAETES